MYDDLDRLDDATLEKMLNANREAVVRLQAAIQQVTNILQARSMHQVNEGDPTPTSPKIRPSTGNPAIPD